METKKNNKIILIGLAIFISVMAILGAINTNGIRSIVGSMTKVADSYSGLDKDVEEAELIRVVDGDTLIVSINGEEQRLRLVEIDCAESVAPQESRNTKEGDEAHHFTENLLKDVKQIYLTKDTSEVDRYGRLLRLVWLSRPNNVFNEKELREKCVNAIILLNGYAKVVKYDDTGYVEIFSKFEKEGRKKKKQQNSN